MFWARCNCHESAPYKGLLQYNILSAISISRDTHPESNPVVNLWAILGAASQPNGVSLKRIISGLLASIISETAFTMEAVL